MSLASDDGALPLGEIEPGEKQSWHPAWSAEPDKMVRAASMNRAILMNQIGANGLWLINLIRQALDDQDEKRVTISMPGESDAGEVYVEVVDIGLNFAIRVEPM